MVTSTPPIVRNWFEGCCDNCWINCCHLLGNSMGPNPSTIKTNAKAVSKVWAKSDNLLVVQIYGNSVLIFL